MLHRKLLSLSYTFSLIVAFGFAQIGAISHQIGHDIAHVNALSTQINADSSNVTLNTATQNTPAKSLPDHTLCEQCVGFSGLSHVVQTAAYTFAAHQSSHAHFTQTAFFTASLKSLSRSARAPPFSLV